MGGLLFFFGYATRMIHSRSYYTTHIFWILRE